MLYWHRFAPESRLMRRVTDALIAHGHRVSGADTSLASDQLTHRSPAHAQSADAGSYSRSNPVAPSAQRLQRSSRCGRAHCPVRDQSSVAGRPDGCCVRMTSQPENKNGAKAPFLLLTSYAPNGCKDGLAQGTRSDPELTLFPEPIHLYSRSGHNLSAVKTGLSPRFCFQAATSS